LRWNPSGSGTLDGIGNATIELGTVSFDTINEKTTAGGVTIDGVLLKDGAIVGTISLDAAAFDTISEKTSGSGVTVDSVLCKDGGVTATADIDTSASLKADTIAGHTAATGVTVDSVLLKDDIAECSKYQLNDSNTEIWEDASSNLSFKDAVAPKGTYTLDDLAMWGGVRNAADFASGSSTGGIQEAIDDLGGTGGHVYLPPGTYTVTTAINVPTGLVLTGAGRSKTQIHNTDTSGGHAIAITTGNRGAVIEHLEIVGETGGGDGINIAANFGHIQLRDLKIDDCGGDGIDASAGNGIDIVIDSVRVTSAVGMGFNLEGASTINSPTLISCYANACGTNGFAFVNIGNGTLISCMADSNDIGYDEANTTKGFTVTGGGQITLIGCRGSIQPIGFEIASSADVMLMQPETTGTPSDSFVMTSAATGDNWLITPNFDGSESIDAAAKLSRMGTRGAVDQLLSVMCPANKGTVIRASSPATWANFSVDVAGTEKWTAGLRGSDDLALSRRSGSGLVNFDYAMNNSSKDPTTDAPADWLEIKLAGTTYYIPVYAAS